MQKAAFFLSLIVLFAFTFPQVQANETSNPWWFEVELILFERDTSPETLEEQFPLQVTQIDTQGMRDFITETLVPDFDFLRQGASLCNQENQVIPFPAQTRPVVLTDEPPIATSLLQNALLHDPEWVTSTRPSEQFQSQLDRFFEVSDEDLGKHRDHSQPVFDQFDNTSIKSSSPEIKLPDSLYCQWPTELTDFYSDEAYALRNNVKLSTVPATLQGIEYPFADKAYTLPKQLLQLKTLKTDINRTRGLNVLLHTAWRQNVIVGRDNAPWYRIYAGENFGQEYYYSGLPKRHPEAEDRFHNPTLYEQIAAVLAAQDYQNIEESESPAALLALQQSKLNDETLPVWTVDGRLKVFIEYIGRTPYLHIDSDLNFRKPVVIDWSSFKHPVEQGLEPSSTTANNQLPLQPNFLQAFHFDQLRRMISTEIHYFDHPMFGMVVQIRRYNRPAAPDEQIAE
ncbi:CsiV family protein [Planctobacterium marinum]|uniref:CsiV family protein n=1 Tax=Planctobacterium marinum TaxID=1631968 RepID=UPI001E4D855B|nr:CsiV family protein [Planctobacterium marinum]MCC2604178.1 peptidoglycan binding protein CsiV [Planctobacterium marinum]